MLYHIYLLMGEKTLQFIFKKKQALFTKKLKQVTYFRSL
jgi:hypothetical protein